MKVLKLIVSGWPVYTLILILCIFIVACCARQPSATSDTDAYHYPVTPGSAEWKAFTSHDQMLQASQVPASTLKKMSTEGLVVTVMNYPLYGEMLVYNTPQQGFDAVKSRFNGLQQLLRRDDAGVELLASYCKMDPLAVDESWGDAQKGKYSFVFTHIETMLAQDAILVKLTKSQLQELLAVSLEKYDEKQQHEIYGGGSLTSTLWVMGKALQKAGDPSFTEQVQQNTRLQRFLADGFFPDDAVVDAIISSTEKYLGL